MVAARSVRHSAASVRAVKRLPTLSFTLSECAQGVEIARNFSGRRAGIPKRLAVSVLEIPIDPKLYMKGRSKQALRTNCRRARDTGISCRQLDPSDARKRVGQLLEARQESYLFDALARHADDDLGDFWVAEDASNEPVVLALTTADSSFARLDWMMTAPRSEKSDARYLISSYIVESLSARGIRHLGVDSVFLLPPGLRHFQQLLGFQPTNISINSG